MLAAFKIKPFDLEPIYEEWKDGPVFKGNRKKDPPVEEWLEQIKEGCIKRGVPEEYWYKVAQHFMGPKARARLDELKEVICKVHGGKYRWTWKKFRIALLNMGWDIDRNETRSIKISGKSLGQWFTRKKDGSEAPFTEEPESLPVESSRSAPRLKPSRRGSVSQHSVQSGDSAKSSSRTPHPPVGRRAATEPFSSKGVVQRPTLPGKTRSDTAVTTRSSLSLCPTKANTIQTIEIISPETSHGGEVMSTTQAPVWLLNACNALDFITSEHPKAMSVLSAILITVGSIPAIPAISAGAGGAVLASGAAHAIGAIAVGVGQALSMSVKSNQNQSNPSGNSNAITHK